MLIELAALAYCADKSNKMDAQALAKRSKAFTKEAEARDLVYQKRSTAEKKMQNVAKKKRAIIESTLPRFVEVYQKIQKIDLTISDKNELAVYNQFQKSNAIQASLIFTLVTSAATFLLAQLGGSFVVGIFAEPGSPVYIYYCNHAKNS